MWANLLEKEREDGNGFKENQSSTFQMEMKVIWDWNVWLHLPLPLKKGMLHLKIPSHTYIQSFKFIQTLWLSWCQHCSEAKLQGGPVAQPLRVTGTQSCLQFQSENTSLRMLVPLNDLQKEPSLKKEHRHVYMCAGGNVLYCCKKENVLHFKW